MNLQWLNDEEFIAEGSYQVDLIYCTSKGSLEPIRVPDEEHDYYLLPPNPDGSHYVMEQKYHSDERSFESYLCKLDLQDMTANRIYKAPYSMSSRGLVLKRSDIWSPDGSRFASSVSIDGEGFLQVTDIVTSATWLIRAGEYVPDLIEWKSDNSIYGAFTRYPEESSQPRKFGTLRARLEPLEVEVVSLHERSAFSDISLLEGCEYALETTLPDYPGPLPYEDINPEITLLRLDSGEATPLGRAHKEAFENWYSWSDMTETLAYTMLGEDGNPNILVIYDVESGEKVQLSLEPDMRIRLGSFSPDGKSLVYLRYHDGSGPTKMGSYTVFSLDKQAPSYELPVGALTGVQVPFFLNDYGFSVPQWSPDGRRIATLFANKIAEEEKLEPIMELGIIELDTESQPKDSR